MLNIKSLVWLLLLWAGLALAQEKITLTLASISSDQDPVKAVIAEYTKQHPNVTINATFAPIDQYNVVLRTQLASGTGPDVMFVYAGGYGNPMSKGTLVDAGYLADLSEQAWVKDVPRGDRSSVAVKNKTYILPINKLLIGLWYNKKIFQDNGLKPPRTWDELLGACASLSKAGIIPLALGNQTPFVTQLFPHGLTATTVYSKNPGFDLDISSGKTSFAESAGYKEALQKYLDLDKRGCFNKFPNGTPYEEVVQMMATGKAAMAVQTSGLALQVARYGMPSSQLGFIPVPLADPGKTWIFASIISSYGVNAKSKNLAAAKDFIKFLSDPNSLNIYLNGRVPAIPYPQIKVDPVFSEMLSVIRYGQSAPVGVFWPNAKVQEVYLKGIQQLFAGQTTIEQLLAEMDKATKP